MADDEAERDGGARSATAAEVAALRERLRELGATVTTGAQAAEAGSVAESPEQAASRYCERFCQTLVDYSSRWKIEEDPQPLVEVYTAALLSYATTAPHLSSQCEEVNLVLERLTLSCVELLLSLPKEVPTAVWETVQSSVQAAQSLLQQKGVSQLRMLSMVAQESGPWANATLHSILSKETPDTGRVHEFLSTEGPVLLEMRIKHLIKDNQVEKAALLARACAEHPELGREGRFQQTYLVCLCAVVPRELLMQELSKVDCRDALEMICNVESEGDEKGAFSLCSGFLTRQLLSGDMYCAWELTLFWSKLLKRLESSAQVFLDKCRQMSLLSKTVYHILFFIKVVQSEFEDVGLPVCIEMCIRALKMETEESGNTKATICKTVSCLLPSDLEVKRACQLTEFLLEPTVDSYYAVETLYNEPDQKLEEESLPVPNSLRCELLLVFKTHWPFDPEFWDWKTLKRHCLALMGEEASIVSSIDELNDSEIQDGLDDDETAKGHEFRDQIESFWDTTNELNEITDERRKKREIKKLREKGFISARFRNWQAYMQYCVLCDKEFLGHRIVRHAQTHVKDGMYSCPICAESFDSKEVLVPHVASHVKQSCKERLAAMKTSKKLANASKITVADSALQKDRLIERPIWKSKNVLNDVDLSQSNNADASALAKDEISAIRAEYTDEYSCPVANCRKGFKYFRNLIAHVKAHKNNEEAKRFLEMQSKKVVCQYCRRQFVSVVHLNDHLQVHCGVKPYICIQLNCKASFLSNTELLVHRKEHTVFKAKCMFPNCGRVFHEAYMLYDHEAQHYKTFTCREPSCGKVFHSQSQLDLHQEDHLAKEEPLTAEDHTPPVDNVDLPPQSLNGQPNNFAPKQEPSHSTPTDQEEVCEEGPQQNEPNMAANMHLCPPVPVKVKHSVESMLNPAPGPGPGQVSECSALDPNQQQFSAPRPDTSVIRSPVTACLSNPNQPRLADTSVQHDAGNMVSQDQSLLPVTYQSVLQDSNLSSQLDILQDPTQSLPLHNQGSNQSDASCVKVEGHVDNRGPVPAHHLDLFPNHNVPPSEQTPQCLSIVTPGVHPSAASTAPPQTVSLPVYGSVTSNTVSPPVSLRNPVPPEGEKERHNCAFETCTRNYSSYRSVTKHMKAAHPEFYVQWKLAKKNNRILKPIIRTVSTGGNINSVMPSQDRRVSSIPVPVVQMQMQSTSSQSVPYSTVCPNPAVTSTSLSQSEACTNRANPNQIENILNPILLSQLGNSQNQPGTVQSHIEPSGSWSSQPGNHADHEVVCPSHVMSSNLHPLPTQSYPSQINASGTGLQPTETSQPAIQTAHPDTENLFLQSPVDNSSRQGENMGKDLHPHCVSSFATSVNSAPPAQMNNANCGLSHTSPMPSNTEGLDNPLLTSALESLPHSHMPSYLDSLKDPVLPNHLENSSPVYQPHTQNSSFSGFNPPERMIDAQMQNNVRPGFPTQDNSAMQPAVESGQPENRNILTANGNTLTVKRTKRNKRAKWPAIIKDGKFICCRCFREFTSPKSLGGHLSKRSHCKPFDETELSAELPTSFLDLLNSPHVLNAPQNAMASNFNPSATFKDQPSQPLDRGSLDSRFFPNVTFPQANGSTYSSADDQNGAVLKEVMDSPAIQNLFESSGIPQQTFQNPSGSCPSDGRLPESTVIQHTGNVTVKTENQPQRIDLVKHDTSSAFGSNDFSDPISQMLAENNSSVSLSSLPTDHLNQVLRAETLMKMRDMKGNGDPQPGALSNDGLLEAMASLAQNLMTNPLLQITSSEPCQQTVMPTSPQDDAHKEKLEKDVKKKLREQILAGDLLRRASLSQTATVDVMSSSRNSTVLNGQTGIQQTVESQQSLESSRTVQLPPGNKMNSGMVVVPTSENESSAVGHKHPGVIPSEPVEGAVPGITMTNDTDTGPAVLSGAEDETVVEIQRALQRLDLDKEVYENTQVVKNCSPVTTLSNPIVNNDLVKPNIIITQEENLVKPFVCHNEGCNYRAMTKDALFKHLSKQHNYTGEMINEIKKNHGKFAPFRCQMCSKTFTRNSNLRAHCQTVHSFSQDDMVKFKLARNFNKKVDLESNNGQVGVDRSVQNSTLPHCGRPNVNITKQHMCTDGGQERLDASLTQNVLHMQEKPSQEYHSRTFEEKTALSAAAQDSRQNNICSLGPQVQPVPQIPTGEQAPQGMVINGPPIERHASMMGTLAAEQRLNVFHATVPSMPGQQLSRPPAGRVLPDGVSSSGQVAPGPPQRDPPQGLGVFSQEMGPQSIKPKVAKPKAETPKKIKEKKERKPALKNGEVDNTFSPYRPYRCVHHGCVAAFTIQHNLILHYKAVHQSHLPKFEGNDDEQDEPREDVKVEQESEDVQVNEFRCQVKDCSRIFQEVTGLLQHYLQLHKFTLDKAGTLINSINLGRFQCDQPECDIFFTAFWKYIAHIEEDHKEAKFSKVEAIDGLFRCEVEGCDRGYATRSNLLRHTMKKHQDLYKIQLMTQRKNQDREKFGAKKPLIETVQTGDGKENMQNNKKMTQKGIEKKKNDDVKNNHWTKYGKPSLKSKEEASVMCTKKFPLQYPCMIKGCETVVSSERNIMKHYIRHGLAERYLEQQRSYFIFCKKLSRSKCKYWSSRGRAKFVDSSTETSENEDAVDTGTEASETESAKPTSRKDEIPEDAEMSDAKQSTDDSSDTKSVASATIKRRRGRPRKEDCEERLTRSKAMERLRTRSSTVSCVGNGSDSANSSSGTGPANEEQHDQTITLSSFKPMGFEVSFLKFLEESTQSPTKRKAIEELTSEIPLKRERTIQLKTATVLCKRSDVYVRPKAEQNCIDFRNPQKLTSLKNVKIVVDNAFSHVADLLLKQLQEMRPLVILQK
ncbi:zinc finger protein 292b [Scleropages formosus]|uniref:Zinc finger protein 292b n=1 Tax=Scleropages formosus TaxID=113540 RepID=A0A8C9SKD1_SCLFO|nr:zinc finger protein 292 [Scleropages formosus]